MEKVRLWDWPVRLVHWSFALLFVALWITGETGRIDLHKGIGIVMLGLVTFRLLWGLLGSQTARFATFLRGPAAVIAYLKASRRKDATPVVGHNPLGGWSVVALLGLLAAQVTIGLFTQDVDGIASGPLTHLISYDAADAAREMHGLLFNLLLAMVGVHLAAILFYLLVKRDNLVRPMLSGRKTFAGAVPPPRFAPAWHALLCAVMAALLAGWLWLGAPLSIEATRQAWQAPAPEEAYY